MRMLRKNDKRDVGGFVLYILGLVAYSIEKSLHVALASFSCSSQHGDHHLCCPVFRTVMTLVGSQHKPTVRPGRRLARLPQPLFLNRRALPAFVFHVTDPTVKPVCRCLCERTSFSACTVFMSYLLPSGHLCKCVQACRTLGSKCPPILYLVYQGFMIDLPTRYSASSHIGSAHNREAK